MIHRGSTPQRGSNWEDNKRDKKPDTLLNYRASLFRSNLAPNQSSVNQSLLRRLEEEGLQKGKKRESNGNLHYCYENSRTWWTTKDGQCCHHLPTATTVPWGVTHFLANTKPRHHVRTRCQDFSCREQEKSPSTQSTNLRYSSPGEKTYKIRSR